MTVRKFSSTLAKFKSTLALNSVQMTYFSETAAPMVLKLQMQYDEVAGHQNDKISLVENQKVALLLKKAKPLKSTFSPEPLDLFGRNIVYRA